MDVSKMEMGDVIDVLPYAGQIVKNGARIVGNSRSRPDVLLDEVRAVAVST